MPELGNISVCDKRPSASALPPAPSEVSVNATLYAELTNPDPIVIPVVDSADDPVGTVTPGVRVAIANSTFNLVDTNGGPLDSASVKATATETLVAPNGDISFNATPADAAVSGQIRNIVLKRDGAVFNGYTYDQPTHTLDVPSPLPNEGEHDLVWPYDYIGIAPNGSLTSAPVWTITRTEMFIDGSVDITHAINVAWDDHLTVIYT